MFATTERMLGQVRLSSTIVCRCEHDIGHGIDGARGAIVRIRAVRGNVVRSGLPLVV